MKFKILFLVYVTFKETCLSSSCLLAFMAHSGTSNIYSKLLGNGAFPDTDIHTYICNYKKRSIMTHLYPYSVKLSHLIRNIRYY